MWKWIGSPASCATDHNGSQWWSPRIGSPYRCGSPVNSTPRAPAPASRSISATVVGTSQNGVAITGSSRRASAAHHSVRKSLYACTHASLSASSVSSRKFSLPNPATLGYSTCAQIPASSMYRNRSRASAAPGWQSSRVGGYSGGNAGQPAGAVTPSGERRLPCSSQTSIPSMRSTCGTSSRNRAGTRSVQTPGGSVT